MPDPAAPSLRALFMGFAGIGVVGFGGVLPWARRLLVEQRQWLTAPDFLELLALCQFLPGPNVVNLSVAVGARFQGAPGAVAALTGLLAAPIAIVLALGALYARFAHEPFVLHAFMGLASAAAALVLSNAIKIAWPLRNQLWPVLIATLAFIAFAVLRLPLIPTLLVLMPCSVLLMRRT